MSVPEVWVVELLARWCRSLSIVGGSWWKSGHLNDFPGTFRSSTN